MFHGSHRGRAVGHAPESGHLARIDVCGMAERRTHGARLTSVGLGSSVDLSHPTVVACSHSEVLQPPLG